MLFTIVCFWCCWIWLDNNGGEDVDVDDDDELEPIGGGSVCDGPPVATAAIDGDNPVIAAAAQAADGKDVEKISSKTTALVDKPFKCAKAVLNDFCWNVRI